MHMQVRIARIFNTYGPRMCIDDGRVVSNFVAQVTNQEINRFLTLPCLDLYLLLHCPTLRELLVLLGKTFPIFILTRPPLAIMH